MKYGTEQNLQRKNVWLISDLLIRECLTMYILVIEKKKIHYTKLLIIINDSFKSFKLLECILYEVISVKTPYYSRNMKVYTGARNQTLSNTQCPAGRQTASFNIAEGTHTSLWHLSYEAFSKVLLLPHSTERKVRVIHIPFVFLIHAKPSKAWF